MSENVVSLLPVACKGDRGDGMWASPFVGLPQFILRVCRGANQQAGRGGHGRGVQGIHAIRGLRGGPGRRLGARENGFSAVLPPINSDIS